MLIDKCSHVILIIMVLHLIIFLLLITILLLFSCFFNYFFLLLIFIFCKYMNNSFSSYLFANSSINHFFLVIFTSKTLIYSNFFSKLSISSIYFENWYIYVKYIVFYLYTTNNLIVLLFLFILKLFLLYYVLFLVSKTKIYKTF